ncbi:peptide cleavage/export ABC transporter [Streptococcus uberis]
MQNIMDHIILLANTTREGTTALGIINAANALGFKTKAIKADMSLFDIKNLDFPLIVHVIKNNKLAHYYIVYKSYRNHLLIGDPDPSVKIVKMAKDKFAEEWTGVALLFKPSRNYSPTNQNFFSPVSYTKVISKRLTLIFLITIISLIITFISILSSYYLQATIDFYIPNKMFSALEIITIGLISTFILQEILTYFRDYLLILLNQKLSIDIILAYIQHLFKLPLSFFSTRRTGEITSRFNDANSIIDAIASTILTIFLDFLMTICVGMTLFFQNKILFTITLVGIPIYTILILSFYKSFKKMNQELMQANVLVSSTIIEDLNGIETIKALSCEEKSFKRINDEFREVLQKSFRLQKLTVLQSALKKGTQQILNVIILWVGAKLVISGKISIGQLITFNALLVYFTTPIENIINLQNKIQSAKEANNRLNEVYYEKSEFENNQNTKLKIDKLRTIDLKNISFKYGIGHDLLKNINLTIREGEKICIIGTSGSGKTTLAKLIVGFQNPTEGKITINNYDMDKINKKTIRHFINYLPQQPYLFTGTIIENLTFGIYKDISQEKIEEACRIAAILGDIEKMPLKFNTKFSDGFGLSGGQKQRIALVRALLSDSPILILDEATSGLDIQTEKLIINNLLKLKNKTIIFIAHRLAIAEKTDRIIVMNRGKISEMGSHKELISRKGAYYQLLNS